MVIIDDVHVSFESIVDLSQFGLRVNSSEVERLPEILLAVTPQRREELQRNLARVWHRFSYSSYRPYLARIRELQEQYRPEGAANGTLSLPEAVPDLDPERDDAFHTIMAWLHSRIPATR